MRSSYAAYAVAKNCRQRFLWDQQGPPEAVDPQPRRKNTFIGFLLQRVLELFYKEKWWKEPETLIVQFTSAIYREAPIISRREAIIWGPGEQENWIAIALDAIPKIISVIKAERLLAPGVESEFNISVTSGKHILYGRADFILPLPESLTILDGKGGKTYGKYTDPDQLMMYGLGLLEHPQFRVFPDRLGFWWFRHTKIQWRRFNVEDQALFKGRVISTLDLIEKKDYTPTPGQHCRLCDYRSQCEVGTVFVNSRAESKVQDLELPNNVGEVALD